MAYDVLNFCAVKIWLKTTSLIILKHSNMNHCGHKDTLQLQ